VPRDTKRADAILCSVTLMRVLSHCFPRARILRRVARPFELLNNWRHNNGARAIIARSLIFELAFAGVRRARRASERARAISASAARATLYLIHHVLILILISMHIITGWVSRNLHAITMRRVRRAGAFDGCENNAMR